MSKILMMRIINAVKSSKHSSLYTVPKPKLIPNNFFSFSTGDVKIPNEEDIKIICNKVYLDEKQIALAKSIKISENCTKKIKELLDKNKNKKYLRLMVEGGGCSGYQYIFQMDNTINEKDDIVLQKNDAEVVIDKISIPFLEGAYIDYKETMIKSAFIVSENPKAEISCSCGTSFSPKLNTKL